MLTIGFSYALHIIQLLLGPVAKFRFTAWLGAAWAAGQQHRAQDFAGKILE